MCGQAEWNADLYSERCSMTPPPAQPRQLPQKDLWTNIHKTATWGKYPNEELIRFLMHYFGNLTYQERNQIKILDLGVGGGRHMSMMRQEGFEAYGIDISEVALQRTKELLTTKGIPDPHNLSVGDATDLSQFPDNTFDAVIDCATIQHISEEGHTTAFDEINRVLKPKGLFWIVHAAAGCSDLGEEYGQCMYATREEMERMGLDASFNIKHLYLTTRWTFDKDPIRIWVGIFSQDVNV